MIIINKLNKKTKLHRAAKTGNFEKVRALIIDGARFDIKNNEGLTPLYLAVEKGHLYMVLALIAYGAQLNTRIKLEKLHYT